MNKAISFFNDNINVALQKKKVTDLIAERMAWNYGE